MATRDDHKLFHGPGNLSRIDTKPNLHDIIVFGVASNGTVEQWDGHSTPKGILLRWFVKQPLLYPELGFEIYRSSFHGIELRVQLFDDQIASSIQGQSSWHTEHLTLACISGLRLRSAGNGRWDLLIQPGSPVTIKFSFPTRHMVINFTSSSQIDVIGRIGGAVVFRGRCNDRLDMRTRGLEEVELSGDNAIERIQYSFLGEGNWKLLAHRCLPVRDAKYRCAPQPSGSEADEARSRLPPSAAAQWRERFDQSFGALLPAIRRLATGESAMAIPPDINHQGDVRISGDERAIIDLATLDPHVARIFGLGYDDPLDGELDGLEYGYKVIGRWLALPISVKATDGQPIDYDMLLRTYGIRVVPYEVGHAESGIVVQFPATVFDLSIVFIATVEVHWTAYTNGKEPVNGTVFPGTATVNISQVQFLSLVPVSADLLVLKELGWSPFIERVGWLPGIVATDPGYPSGPRRMSAVIQPPESTSAVTVAALNWPIYGEWRGEGEPVSYQIGHRRLASDPSLPPPEPDAPSQNDLLYDGAPIFVQSENVEWLPTRERALHIDRNEGKGLDPGWWGWWVRGVDLFGRVSVPSPWELATVVDAAPPPAPLLVEAEWVQRNLPASSVAAMGHSSEARRWLDSSTSDEGLVVSWAFGPEQATIRPDVDGFRLFVRRPFQPAGAPPGAALEYGNTWPSSIASFGPLTIQASGTITADPVKNPPQNITLSSVQPLARTLNATSSTPFRSACVTDLELDGASSIFVGGTLTIGGQTYPIVSNGDGARLTIVVEHRAGAAPSTGAAVIRPADGTLIEVTTNVSGFTSSGGLRARSGALVIGAPASDNRIQVLCTRAGVFLCRAGNVTLNSGDAVTWYPVWSVALDNAGFGPVASDTVPVANAQVAVCAVRKMASSAIQSTLSTPLTVTAVDVTEPEEPNVDPIPFDPNATCARLASRADWYGKSKFRLSWTAQGNRLFTVYRALGDEVYRLDGLHLDNGGSHTFPESEWPAGVYGDAARKSRVETQLTAIAAARAISDPAARQAAIEAAYQALTIDTQMLLARQPFAWPAYIALFGEPIESNSHEDILDGRSEGHWFYRVTSRTRAGLESPPSEPTPPICCPDVVPPAAPLAHIALADEGAVKLRWLASPDSDLDHYDVFVSQDPEAVAELENMTPVAVHTPQPHRGGEIITFPVRRQPGEWCFWIVAVDNSGNRSVASRMLRGRALLMPPEPPVWIAASPEPVDEPKYVSLSWRHETDQRLACLVERRPLNGGYWGAISGWLPRGTYRFIDGSVILDIEWEYRLRARDHMGQEAVKLPTISTRTS